jgi:hypothetical protein
MLRQVAVRRVAVAQVELEVELQVEVPPFLQRRTLQ